MGNKSKKTSPRGGANPAGTSDTGTAPQQNSEIEELIETHDHLIDYAEEAMETYGDELVEAFEERRHIEMGDESDPGDTNGQFFEDMRTELERTIRMMSGENVNVYFPEIDGVTADDIGPQLQESSFAMEVIYEDGDVYMNPIAGYEYESPYWPRTQM